MFRKAAILAGALALAATGLGMTAMGRGIQLTGTAARHSVVMRSRSAYPHRQGQTRPARRTAISGPGCAVAGTAQTGQGGDGWAGIRGGEPACGGQALATRTTGTVGLVQDTYTWSFRIGHPASCAVQVFVPDASASSGIAYYDVYASSAAPVSKISSFYVIQPHHRGQWFGVGDYTTPDGVLRIQLTDRPAYPGGSYYVTASAVAISCR